MSCQGIAHAGLAEAWCECLLPGGGTVPQQMPRALCISHPGCSQRRLLQFPGWGPQAAPPVGQSLVLVQGSCPPPLNAHTLPLWGWKALALRHYLPFPSQGGEWTGCVCPMQSAPSSGLPASQFSLREPVCRTLWVRGVAAAHKGLTAWLPQY